MGKIKFKNLYLDCFIALDVETTGLDKNLDKIIEISAVKFENGIEVDLFSELINPERNIPQFIENLTGITNNMVANKPTFHTVSDNFLKFIANYPLVGHNIEFDLTFINNELTDSKYAIKQDYICDTYYLSRIFYYYLDSYKLESICAKLDVNTGNSHRALDDSRSSALLFIKILHEMLDSDINTLHMLSKCNNQEKSSAQKENFNNKLFNNLFDFKLNEKSKPKISTNQSDEFLFKNLFIFKKNEKNIQDIHNINQILGSEGILSHEIEKYEYRESQKSFSEFCLNTIKNKDILISEAGAGLGKSLGYLAPSILNVESKNIIVSTSTHNLQNQLLNKDIPLISKLLNKNVKALVIKGKNNYLCYNKLLNVVENINKLLHNEEYLEIMTLMLWANETKTGDISECTSFNIKKNKRIWDLVKFNNDHCYKHNNMSSSKCFYNNVIKHSKDSNVFIINHALLASNIENQDLLFKTPPICIIDEAHKLVDNFRNQLSNSLSYFDVQKDFETTTLLIDGILKNKDNQDNLLKNYNSFKSRMHELIEIFKEFSLICAESMVENKDLLNDNYVIDLRYSKIINEKNIDSFYCEKIIFLMTDVVETFNEIKKHLFLLYDEELSNVQKIKLSSIYSRLKSYNSIIKNEIFNDKSELIRWVKIYLKKGKIKFCIFNSAPFSIKKTMTKVINNSQSLIFCSATLAIEGDFDFFLQESGINNMIIPKDLQLKIFPSPFFYNDQIKLFLYNSHEKIDSDPFINKISKLILEIKNKINKRILILCTSFKQINAFRNKFDRNKMSNIYYQNANSSRDNLLKQYIENSNSILFGTSSFWEGVDLPNDLLEILIILKVPFSNPNNPIISAKIDFYNQTGQDPFYKYQIPEAILKLKQGIGRLIRNHHDNGICILTDPRLINKSYGQNIIASLPVSTHITRDNSVIINKAETFLNI